MDDQLRFGTIALIRRLSCRLLEIRGFGPIGKALLQFLPTALFCFLGVGTCGAAALQPLLAC